MKYVTLGNTGISVSKLCFGSLTIGPMQANLSLDTGSDIVAYALQKGINFFDTAQLYETYPYLREGMKKAGKFDAVISSKTYAYTRELAAEAVEQARRELDRDYIDIFMLHEQESIHTLRGHKEALDYLFECKEKGIIRAVGASTHRVSGVRGVIETDLDVVHPLINIAGLGISDGSREDMENAIRDAHQKGIGTFSMKPFGGGNLFKKASECLDYILSLDFVDVIAAGMQSQEEVDANVFFFENGFFPQDASDALKNKKRHLHIEDWCEACGNCVARCKQNALSIKDGRAVCDDSKCVLCGYCSSVCPEWCIKVV